MQPLAPYGNSSSQSNTNLSRLISLSLIDENNNDISIFTTVNNSIELIIPRDLNTINSPKFLQNVTSINTSNQSFYLHFVNLTRFSNLTVSLHLEIHPLNINLAYLLIYRFDDIPQLNINDGSTLFCPSSKC